MLYNWSVTIALLLRESDELISTALRPTQASILLRVFVHCAADLSRKRRAFASAVALSASDRQLLEGWDGLNDNLHAHLPALLTRFKDDEANLSVLVELLQCTDYASNERALKALLKVVVELLQISRQAPILRALVSALRSWMQLGGTAAGTVELAVKALVDGCWEGIVQGTAQLRSIVDRRDSSAGGVDGKGSSSSSSKRKSKFSSSSVSQVNFKCFFWKTIEQYLLCFVACE